MVWTSKWAGGHTDIHDSRLKIVNVQSHLDEVNRPIIPQRIQLLAQFIFMHNNAPCHRTLYIEFHTKKQHNT